MKPDSPLSQLPSIGELLKHPTVQAVVERVNQTTIAQRATGFLDEMRGHLRNRGGQHYLPSLGQLAQRLAQRLLGPAEHGVQAVNATGLVCSPRWPAPLAERAVQEMARSATDYRRPETNLAETAAAALVELTNAEAAWVASSYDAVARLTHECQTSAELAQVAGLTNPAEFRLLPVPTLAERLAAGVGLVVCDGGGLIGGPSCGIAVGGRDAVERLREHEWARLVAIDDFTLAALVATLAEYRHPEKVMHNLPLWQLLSAPQDNLRQRAERLAELIAEGENVSRAEAIACESTWCETGSSELAGPSWAIRIEADDVESLGRKLDDAAPPIVTRREQQAILVDLRSVFPRWDQHLAAVFSGGQPELA
jgi:hypothetical protein